MIVIRRDYFFLGLGIRILMMAIFILVNQTGVYNDASEIIYQAFINLFKGTNPYSISEYILKWGDASFSQPFNYGPFTLILLLPAMILPFWYNNLWIGMVLMINVYSFLTAEIVSKLGSIRPEYQKNATIITSEKDPRQNQLLYYGGIFFWIIPVGTTCITVFIYAPIFLTVLAFHYLKDPIKSAIFISLAAMSYQLIYLFIPIFGIYHLKRGWKEGLKFVLGCIPSLFMLLLFMIWTPGGIIESLFLYTNSMPYSKCDACGNDFDRFSVFSIPRILYNLSNGAIQIGPQARLVMFLILAVICIFYLFTSKFDSFEELFIIKYIILAIILFTLTTNYGQSHYLIFLYIPLLYYFQLRKPDFRKNTPIGPEIWSWDDFDAYLEIYGELPL